jgi:ferrous iron transport protein A
MRIVIIIGALMTLDQLNFGQTAKIVAIGGGHGLQRHLQQMGLHPGDIVIVSSRGAFRGPLLVSFHGSQIAIGRGIARKIEIEPVAVGPSGKRGGR